MVFLARCIPQIRPKKGMTAWLPAAGSGLVTTEAAPYNNRDFTHITYKKLTLHELFE